MRDDEAKLAALADAVTKGAAVYCGAAVYEEIQRSSAVVQRFGGVELRVSRLAPPDMICVVQLDREAPPFAYRAQWLTLGEPLRGAQAKPSTAPPNRPTSST